MLYTSGEQFPPFSHMYCCCRLGISARPLSWKEAAALLSPSLPSLSARGRFVFLSCVSSTGPPAAPGDQCLLSLEAPPLQTVCGSGAKRGDGRRERVQQNTGPPISLHRTEVHMQQRGLPRGSPSLRASPSRLGGRSWSFPSLSPRRKSGCCKISLASYRTQRGPTQLPAAAARCSTSAGVSVALSATSLFTFVQRLKETAILSVLAGK